MKLSNKYISFATASLICFLIAFCFNKYHLFDHQNDANHFQKTLLLKETQLDKELETLSGKAIQYKADSIYYSYPKEYFRKLWGEQGIALFITQSAPFQWLVKGPDGFSPIGHTDFVRLP